MSKDAPKPESPTPDPANAASGIPTAHRWRDVWQLPALVLSGVLVAGGVATVAALRPKADLAGMLEAAEAMIGKEKYADALAHLNAKVFPYLEKPEMSGDQRQKFHTLVARSIYLWQLTYPTKQDDNWLNVIGEYQEAEKLGAKLDPADSIALTDSFLWLNKIPEAIEHSRRLGTAPMAQRFALMKRLVEKCLTTGKGEERRTAELLAEMLAEPELPRDMRIWATARQAEAMVRAGDVGETIARLLRSMPRLQAGGSTGLGELYLYLGEAYLHTGAADEAAKQLARAADLLPETDPAAGRAQFLLGRLAESDRAGEEPGKRLEEAREKYEWVLARFGGLPIATSALLGLGEVEAARGELEASVQAYQQLVQELTAGMKSPDATPETVSASLHAQYRERYEAQDYNNAVRYIALAESLFGPDDTPTDLIKDLAEVHRKLAEEATIAPAQGAEGTPGASADAAALALAQRHFISSGQYFRQHANRLVLSPGREYADSLWAAADAFDRAGDRESAIASYAEFQAQFPADARQAEAVFRLARAHQARGEFDQAVKLFSMLMESRGAEGAGRFADDSYVPLAQTYLMDNDPANDEKAEALLSTVVSGALGGPQTENFRDAVALLGELLYDKARALESQAENVGAGKDIAALYAQSISRLDEALSRFPDHPRSAIVRYKLADACRLSAGAIEQQLKEGMPESQKRELAATRRDRLKRALTLFETIRRSLDAKDARRRSALEELHLRNAYFYLGDCSYNLAEYDAAVRSYDAARERYSGQPAALVAMVQIVNCYIKLGDFKRATAANEHARRFYASLPDSVWDDPNLPMTRRDWERWLDATADLSRPPQTAGAEKESP